MRWLSRVVGVGLAIVAGLTLSAVPAGAGQISGPPSSAGNYAVCAYSYSAEQTSAYNTTYPWDLYLSIYCNYGDQAGTPVFPDNVRWTVGGNTNSSAVVDSSTVPVNGVYTKNFAGDGCSGLYAQGGYSRVTVIDTNRRTITARKVFCGYAAPAPSAGDLTSIEVQHDGYGAGAVWRPASIVRVAGSGMTMPPQPGDYFAGGTGGFVRPAMIYSEARAEGTCSRTIEPLDGQYYVTFSMRLSNPAVPVNLATGAAGTPQFVAGVGPWFADKLAFDAPWTAPTFDDDLYRVRFKLPPVAQQPVGGWLPQFQIRRRLQAGSAESPRGFDRAPLLAVGGASFVASVLTYTGSEQPFSGSEELTTTCSLTVDLSDPDKGATGTLGPFSPDVEQTTLNLQNQLELCKPPGLAVLNPARFVEGLACVLRVLFVPTTINPFAQVKAEANATVVGDFTTMASSTSEAMKVMREGTVTPSDCAGPVISVPLTGGLAGVPGGANNVPYKPFSVCEASMASMVGTFRTLGLVGLYFAWAVMVMRIGASALGWEVPAFFDRGGDDEAGGGVPS